MSELNKPIIAVIEEDGFQNSLGLVSRFDQKIEGRSLIQFTIENCLSAGRIDKVVLACPLGRRAVIESCLDESVSEEVIWVEHEIEPVARKEKFQRNRKWSHTGWRGGIDHAFSLCEYANMKVMAEVFVQLKDLNPRALVVINSAQPFIASDVLEEELDLFDKVYDKLGTVFATTPPGLNYLILNENFITMLAKDNMSMRELLRYNPSAPQVDPTIIPFCYNAPLEYSRARFRFSADTLRGFRFVESLASAVPDRKNVDAKVLIDAAHRLNHDLKLLHNIPREVEIEITGRSTIEDSLYLEGKTKRSKEEMSVKKFETIIDQLAEYDDVCLTFGGFGDPLLHPGLIDMIHLAKDKGIYGLHVASNGNALSEGMVDELLSSPLDVLSIRLDAYCEETYNLLKSGGSFDHVVSMMNYLLDKKGDSFEGLELLPSLVKVIENLGELEQFYDYWYEKTGWCLLQGFDDMFAQVPDRNVLPLLADCQKQYLNVMEMLTIHADGVVPLNFQDYLGNSPVGNIKDSTITELWHSEVLNDARKQCLNEMRY